MKKTASQIADSVLEKLAINLSQARQATKALMSKNFTRGVTAVDPMKGTVEFGRRVKNLRDHVPVGWGAVRSRPGDVQGLAIAPGSALAPARQDIMKMLPQLPGGKNRIFASGSLTEAPLKQFRAAQVPSGHESITSLRPPQMGSAQREMLNRIGLLHEGAEKAIANKLPIGKSLSGRWALTGSGHFAPEVLLQEGAMLSTLSKRHAPVRQFYQKLRNVHDAPGLAAIQSIYPGYQHGVTRLSRHARKRVGDLLR